MSVLQSAPQSDALRAQIFQRLHPHAYLERFLAEGVRPDGREPSEWRDVLVNVGVSFFFAPHRRTPRHSRVVGRMVICIRRPRLC